MYVKTEHRWGKQGFMGFVPPPATYKKMDAGVVKGKKCNPIMAIYGCLGRTQASWQWKYTFDALWYTFWLWKYNLSMLETIMISLVGGQFDHLASGALVSLRYLQMVDICKWIDHQSITNASWAGDWVHCSSWTS